MGIRRDEHHPNCFPGNNSLESTYCKTCANSFMCRAKAGNPAPDARVVAHETIPVMVTVRSENQTGSCAKLRVICGPKITASRIDTVSSRMNPMESAAQRMILFIESSKPGAKYLAP